ncbi:MAG: DUF2358 domain-containing protein [Cyanobacteria bacterium SID2]|nr:DUF2358 domain-containing protein [Cyanobacteria bacterium SID2]MBP0006383.1 DUF2358 domain-containing protein [Cyanobacteria bacterium SBC]
MDILAILKQDYENFPENQTYDIYAEDVYFQDPLNQFRGLDRYRQNIDFIRTWFRDIRLDLHQIDRTNNLIKARWTLNWNTPLPGYPRIAIPGWSELELDSADRIVRHIDYWNCSRWDVVKQHFPR